MSQLSSDRFSQSDEAEKLTALEALVEALIPQRNKDVRHAVFALPA